MEKSNFFAKFVSIENHTFRYDTRIYLNEITEPSDNDICIGAIVGKNPGSASYKKDKVSETGFHVIDLNNDKLLPTIKNIINLNKKDIKLNQYIQVLNLFYLCDSSLNSAIEKYLPFYQNKNDLICKTENKHFPFVWYVWGGFNKKLSEYKKRFEFIKADKRFFFTKENNCYQLINGVPSNEKLAKHIQGFPYKTNQEISGLMKGLFD